MERDTDWKRDAQEMAATMDHSDIRGLATAFHLFLAGLPRSRNWDQHRDALIKFFEDSPHRSRASRYRFGVELADEWWSASHLRDKLGVKATRLGRDFHLTGGIPGVSVPSEADEVISIRLRTALGLVGVRVIDHFVVGESVTSMAELGLLRSPLY